MNPYVFSAKLLQIPLLKTYRHPFGFRLSNDPGVLQVKVSDAARHGQPAVNVRLSQTIPGDKTSTFLYPRGRGAHRKVLD